MYVIQISVIFYIDISLNILIGLRSTNFKFFRIITKLFIHLTLRYGKNKLERSSLTIIFTQLSYFKLRSWYIASEFINELCTILLIIVKGKRSSLLWWIVSDEENKDLYLRQEFEKSQRKSLLFHAGFV